MATLHARLPFDEQNSVRTYYCGLTSLPEGDKWIDDHLVAAYLAGHPEIDHCIECFGEKRPEFGTPISKLSGRPGHEGFDEWCRISESWGYD